jgi:hypothetical protein
VTRNARSSADPPPPTIAVELSVIRTCSARPRCSEVIVCRLKLAYLLSTLPPVIAAMSSSLCSLRSPNPGARTTQAWKVRFTWLCTSMLSAVPSTFSAMISSGRGARMILSSTGISCWTW